MQRRDFLSAAALSSAWAMWAPATGHAQTPAASPSLVDAKGDTLLVIEKNAHALGYYSLKSGARTHSVELAQFPHEFVVDAQAQYAFVGIYGVEFATQIGQGGSHIAVIDLRQGKQVHQVECAPYNRLHGMGMDHKGRLYALSEEKAVLLVVDNPAKDARPTSAVPTGDVKPHMFALTRDGERAYVTALLSNTLSLVRPHDPVAPVLRASTGRMPEGVCLSPDEKTVLVSNRRSTSLVAMDSNTLKVLRTATTRGDALRVYWVGDEVITSNLQDQSITFFTPDLKETARVALAGRPIGISFNPSGTLAFVSVGPDKLVIMDVKARKIVSQLDTRSGVDLSWLLSAA